MASRAIRSDVVLSFGLVNATVDIVKLSDDPRKGLSLTMGSPDGNGVSQRYLDETTGAIYEPGEVLKGVYDDPKNKIGFHPVPNETMSAIDATCAIEGLVIDGFVSADGFPMNRIEDTYFLAAKGGPVSSASLALIREAMQAEAVVGIGKCTISKRQRPFALYVSESGAMVLALLTFAANCTAREHEATEALASIAANPAHVELARTLVQNMIGTTDIDSYSDDSIPQREALIIAAAAGETITVPEAAAAAAPVVDLEAALLASIGATPKAKAGAAAAKSKSKPAAKAA